jgi:FKBP-type peptidyl-prolyl cis-trans isomerase
LFEERNPMRQFRVMMAVAAATLLMACNSAKQAPVTTSSQAAAAAAAPQAVAPAAAKTVQEASPASPPDAAASAQTGTAGPGAAAPPSSAPAKLDMTDLKTGNGPAIKAGQTAVVHYTGWLYSGTAPDKKGKKFDSSVDRNEPFRFPLGGGQVIPGWDQGVAGMQVGGKRRLVIPPDLAYGDGGAGGVIPPGATLVFDVELLGIE